jgi:hypothetical protein
VFWFPHQTQQLNPGGENDDPLVMKIFYRNTSALVQGDVRRQREREIARQQPQATLLKAGSPRQRNFNHPPSCWPQSGLNLQWKETLNRLEQAQVSTYRTDPRWSHHAFSTAKPSRPNQ